ncbi:unnamed protein product [Somion occarium]|uniref:AB hydrolase-1 domain-containing protein n=1 Tax=Somion occarium TaxID=3059160 RepID=A0ABP1D6V9_9APHY
MLLLSKKSVISFKGAEGHDLKAVVARYTKSAEPSPGGAILLFTHAVGAHKEQWLPVIERLFADSELNISEAWSLDAACHGDSLPYNKDLIETDLQALADLAAYGEAVLGLLASGLFPYQNRNVIAVGHSAGCQAIVRSSIAFVNKGEPIPFKTIILVEPVFLPDDIGTSLLSRYIKPTSARKWQWKSRDEAAEYLSSTLPWKRWHKEILEVYEYGIVHSISGSELKTPPKVEAACYPNAKAQAEGLQNLPALTEQRPVHVIFGTRYDFVPKKLRDGFVASSKDRLRSLRSVEGAGHMLVQENPIGCAEAIKAVLRESTLLSQPKL